MNKIKHSLFRPTDNVATKLAFSRFCTAIGVNLPFVVLNFERALYIICSLTAQNSMFSLFLSNHVKITVKQTLSHLK